MTEFVGGLKLCELFFHQHIEAILLELDSSLRYSAALIGPGSEVLGMDTPVSVDHDWGPRCILFLSETDLSAKKEVILNALSQNLPHTFLGFPVGFSDPDALGVRVPVQNSTDDVSSREPVHHRITVTSINQYLMDYLGVDMRDELSVSDWLSLPEQKLLTVVSGRVFRDDDGLLELARSRFTYYPHDVWLYQLAACWLRVEQEEHLVVRASQVGDELGSIVIASRLVRDMMRLCFLMEKRYAPYPKWFGSAFRLLECGPRLEPILRAVLVEGSQGWSHRERCLVAAFEAVAALHKSLSITPGIELPVTVRNFHDRGFKVISMGEYSTALLSSIQDPAVRQLPGSRSEPCFGGVDFLSDNTDALCTPTLRPHLKALYDTV